MKTRLMIFSLVLAGCAGSPERQGFLNPYSCDPFADQMKKVKEVYRHDDLVAWPTRIGNFGGALAASPLVVMAFLLESLEEPRRLRSARVAMGTITIVSIAVLAYLGGAATGTPALLLDYALVHWWAHSRVGADLRIPPC